MRNPQLSNIFFRVHFLSERFSLYWTNNEFLAFIKKNCWCLCAILHWLTGNLWTSKLWLICFPQKTTITANYFCVRHKNRRKHNQDSKLIFFQNKFTLWHVRLNIYIWKTKFSSDKHYLFGLLFSRNAKKTHTDQSILPTFILCLKRNVWQTLKGSSCKEVFPKCVYHGYNLIRWIFFIPCGNWKTFFFIQLNDIHRFGVTAMLLGSLKQVFWKKSIDSTVTLQCC